MASSKSRKAGGAKKSKSPRCRRCDKTIRVPAGWTHGPAIRRHYWAKHRAVMAGKKKSGKGQSRTSAAELSQAGKAGRTKSTRTSTRSKGRS